MLLQRKKRIKKSRIETNFKVNTDSYQNLPNFGGNRLANSNAQYFYMNRK